MERYKLTLGQKALMTLYEEKDFCVNLMFAFKIKGNFNRNKLKETLQEVIENNDAFRFKFYRDKTDNNIYQYMDDENKLIFEEKNIDGNNYSEKYEKVKEYVRKLLTQVKCLSNEFMWDFILFNMGNEESIFYARMNHLICDGVTIVATLGNILSAYNGIPMKKSLGFSDFLKEQETFENSEEYIKLREKYKIQVDEFKNYERILKLPKINRKYSIIKCFATVDTDKILEFCKSNKLSFFHVSLFFYHVAISYIYKRNDTLITVPIGIRKPQYMNTIGYLLSASFSRLKLDENMKMQDAAILCRNNFFENSKIAPIFFKELIDNKYLIEFLLTYQNQVGNFNKKIMLGDAEIETITDPELIGNTQKVIMNAASVTAMEIDTAITYTLRVGKDIYTDEMREKTGQIFNLAAECLSGKNMTFGEFCKILDNM